jgi:hypothetical protein
MVRCSARWARRPRAFSSPLAYDQDRSRAGLGVSEELTGVGFPPLEARDLED